MRAISDTISVATEPPGAKVFLRGFVEGPEPAKLNPQFIGTTPLTDVEIARGEYILRVERDGHAPFEGSIYGFAFGDVNSPVLSPPIRMQLLLPPLDKSPPNMSNVPGGNYRLVSWRRPSDALVTLDGFFIDRFEVSNLDYKEFISSAGYLKREFWKHPFIKSGTQISPDQAMREFVDRTRLPGPRGWSNQDYPAGKEKHPVTGISWYEAAAYCAFRGKSLPTVFQWEKAARNSATIFQGTTMPWGLSRVMAYHANLSSTGTAPTGTLEFGMSPFGVYDMAGNVAEWFINETSEGYLTGGASWADPDYSFGTFGPFPAFFSSDRLGFRCVVNPPGTASDQGAFRIQLENEVPKYTPAPETQVKGWIEDYRYENAPLEALVIERIETSEWTREKIEFAGARERALGYLYLPKHFSKPWSVVHVIPSGDVFGGFRTVPESIEQQWVALVRSGRAVFTVVLPGMRERETPPGSVLPSLDSVEYVELRKEQITDMRRGLDYLGTRADLSKDQIGLFYASAAGTPWVLPAVDSRYRTVAAFGAGIRKVVTQMRPQINPINFVPHIKVPILFVHGRYDENTPVKNELEPLLALVRVRKRVEFFEGGHRPDQEFLLPLLNSWFDENLGPVRRN